MGNDVADAIRAELYHLAMLKYGNLEVAAAEMGMPYKTLYRGLTMKGRDRTQRVTLDFVLDVASRMGADFATIYARATMPSAFIDSGMDDDVEIKRQSDYDLVSHPYTEETGELMDE